VQVSARKQEEEAMDFSLTRQQEMLRDTVREFAETELAPKVLELDRERKFPWDVVKKAGEMGLIGVMTPKEYGGTDMGHLARMIVIEEVSRVYPPLGFFFQTAHLAQWSIQAHGTDEQKQKYLPKMCKGEIIVGDAITEPAGGSDLAGHQTVAELQGDDYVINGRKCWVTYPEIADAMLVLAKTGDRFSEFIVERGTPGYEVPRRENMTGLQTIPVNEMALTNCRVPKGNLVGEEGKGSAVGLAAVSIMGRTGVAGVGLGIARGCYEAAVDYAKERKLYGQPIANLQAIQYALVDMHVDVECAKWIAYNTAWQLDQGKGAREAAADIARAKLVSTEAANRVANRAVQVLGANGVAEEYHIVRRLRDALPLYAAAGTLDVMKVTLARSILA